MTTTSNHPSRETLDALPHVTLADVRELTAIPVWHPTGPSVAALLRMSRSAAYDAAARDDVPNVRIGGRIMCPVPALRRMLGDLPETPAGSAAVTPAVTSAPTEAPAEREAAAPALVPPTR